jgi:hypothetical protein
MHTAIDHSMLTFTTDLPERDAPHGSCTCTQNAPRFYEAVDLDVDERPFPWDLCVHLRAHAAPECAHCEGSGLVPGAPARDTYIQFADWSPLTAALGIPCSGACTLPEARRAVIRALTANLDGLYRPDLVVHAPPRAQPDGTIALRPVKARVRGTTAEDIRDRVRRLADFVERSARSGAKELRWS